MVLLSLSAFKFGMICGIGIGAFIGVMSVVVVAVVASDKRRDSDITE